MGATYDGDVFAWANEQAALIRARRFDALDLDNIAEEIESVGRSEQRELINRMAVLLAHLLKWQAQPGYRGRSWELTIAEQRIRLDRVLAENPSLWPRLADQAWISGAWKQGVVLARRETGLDDFPEACPWALGDVIRDGWMPA